jgi:hypothetical protein
MSLMLDDVECAALKQALDNYLPQLRIERSRASAREVQHALSVLEEALDGIRCRLADAPSLPAY